MVFFENDFCGLKGSVEGRDEDNVNGFDGKGFALFFLFLESVRF